MRSGSMRQKFSLFINKKVKNVIGGFTEERVLVGHFPCRAKRKKGEQVEDTQNRPKVTYEFITRYSPSIETPAAEAYIRFNGHDYSIDDVDNVEERNIKLVITATRK